MRGVCNFEVVNMVQKCAAPGCRWVFVGGAMKHLARGFDNNQFAGAVSGGCCHKLKRLYARVLSPTVHGICPVNIYFAFLGTFC